MNKKAVSAIIFCIIANVACDHKPSWRFGQLDANQDGYVGPAEGAELDGLTENWQLLDIDKDGHLDKMEFSKFELMIAPPEGPRE